MNPDMTIGSYDMDAILNDVYGQLDPDEHSKLINDISDEGQISISKFKKIYDSVVSTMTEQERVESQNLQN